MAWTSKMPIQTIEVADPQELFFLSRIDIKWLVAFMTWRVKYHTEIAFSQDIYIAQFDALQVKHIYFCRLRMELKNLAKQLFREASLKSYLFRQINKGSQKNIHLELFTSHTTIKTQLVESEQISFENSFDCFLGFFFRTWINRDCDREHKLF